MYTHLLVGLDGSLEAERVLEHAEALAGAFGSRVTLLRATVSAEMLVSESVAGDAGIGQVAPIIDPEPVIEAEEANAHEYLESVLRRLRLRQPNLNVDTETPEGPPDTAIVERAKALGVDLILMTTHGRSGIGRVVFGSTADAVLRHAPCPVLLVRISADANGHKATSA